MNEPLLGENDVAHVVNLRRAKNHDNYGASFALTWEVAPSVSSTILHVTDIINCLCNKQLKTQAYLFEGKFILLIGNSTVKQSESVINFLRLTFTVLATCCCVVQTGNNTAR